MTEQHRAEIVHAAEAFCESAGAGNEAHANALKDMLVRALCDLNRIADALATKPSEADTIEELLDAVRKKGTSRDS
jgi:hypothetical protein